MFKVGILMGSDSDLPIMDNAAKVLNDLGIEHEMTIISAHRTPDRACEYAKTARERGLGAIIAGAGGAAHLAGFIAAMTTLPVIGVPIKTDTLGGLDSLLSIVQMPGGIPVATVAINAALNAGLLAAQILGVHDERISLRLTEYKENLKNAVLAKAEKLESRGL